MNANKFKELLEQNITEREKFVLVVSRETHQLLNMSEMEPMKYIEVVISDEIWTDTASDIKHMIIEYIGEEFQYNSRQNKPWYRKERW